MGKVISSNSSKILKFFLNKKQYPQSFQEERLFLPKEKMRPNSRETFKLLIFQYFLYEAGLLIFLRNHQVNWSKCHSNAGQISQNPSLNHLIDPSFKGVKRIFIINLQTHREKKRKSETSVQPNLRPNHLRA